MQPERLRIALATPRMTTSRAAGLAVVQQFIADAAVQKATIVCFPETYLPGYRGSDFPTTPPPDQAAQEYALQAVQDLARAHNIAVIMPMEWASDVGLLNVAFVINPDGTLQGCQTKNQIPPEEEPYYVAGSQRELFTVANVPFGIAICHEGWRYPEVIRWAARRGAQIVFHPHLVGSDQAGVVPRCWGDPQAPYYEKAMLMRALENTIYFASVNYAFTFQEAATSLIDPEGRCIAHLPYGTEGLLVADLDLTTATGYYAHRFAPGRYDN